MELKKRKIITGLVATGVLAGALAGGGAALASTAVSSQSAVAVAAVSTGLPAAGAADGFPFLRRDHVRALIFATSARYLGLSPAQLNIQLSAKKTLAELAKAKGKPVSRLENAILTAVIKRVDASKLTAAHKAAVIKDVKSNLGAFVIAEHPFRWTA